MIRKEVKDFEPYRVMEGDYRIWLDKNESPFDVPVELKESFMKRLECVEFNRYPPISGEGLKEDLASQFDLDTSQVVIGNGSDQLIDCILDLFVGRDIVIHTPTFGMYTFYAKKKGLNVVEVPLDETYDLPELDYGLEEVRAIFICSPNTPVGNMLNRDRIKDYLDTGYPMVLDEAYVDFAERDHKELMDEYENLIILRTFSKAYGLAALRVGYAMGHGSVMEHLAKIVSPYNVNTLSLRLAEYMLREKEHIRERVEYIRKEREYIASQLSEYTHRSQTNFVMLDLDAYDYLLTKGIVVRKLAGRLEGKIRVTVGTREENREVVEELKEFAGALG